MECETVKLCDTLVLGQDRPGVEATWRATRIDVDRATNFFPMFFLILPSYQQRKTLWKSVKRVDSDINL